MVNQTAGTATVAQENGATVPFTLVSGVWQAPSYAPASLVQNADGTFTFLRRHGHQTLHFAANGQLLSITDANGYVTALAYNSSGQLATVTDPGRTSTHVQLRVKRRRLAGRRPGRAHGRLRLRPVG